MEDKRKIAQEEKPGPSAPEKGMPEPGHPDRKPRFLSVERNMITGAVELREQERPILPKIHVDEDVGEHASHVSIGRRKASIGPASIIEMVNMWEE